MVTIRLSRAGAKRSPFYHIVVTDSRSRRDGAYIERLGFFNPVARGQSQRLSLNLERAEHWLTIGAQTSDRVRDLIKEYRKDPAPDAARVQAEAERKPSQGGEAEAQPSVATEAAPAAAAEGAVGDEAKGGE